MKKYSWQKIYAVLLCVSLLLPIFSVMGMALEGNAVPISEKENWISDFGVEEGSLALDCASAVLMEAESGRLLYAQNMEEAMPPASVTKIMTLLLIMEAIDDGRIRLDDTVTVSAHAASMGGSQVFLKEGEQMPLEDLLKSVVIASANDAAVALAEYLHGSVAAFVKRMNERAAELGMTSTKFENVTGLDDTAEAHLTSAKDIALMSQALIRHEKILEYSSIWMDTIRDGAFGLTNTNRLVRFYRGCTGLKTGSTSKAGFCVSVTAERDGMSLICVIMGAESRDVRNAAATSLLDWGFANYGVWRKEAGECAPISVKGGVKDSCSAAHAAISVVLPKNLLSGITEVPELPSELSAPVRVGDVVGKIRFCAGETTVAELGVYATESVPKIGFFELLKRVFAKFLLI